MHTTPIPTYLHSSSTMSIRRHWRTRTHSSLLQAQPAQCFQCQNLTHLYIKIIEINICAIYSVSIVAISYVPCMFSVCEPVCLCVCIKIIQFSNYDDTGPACHSTWKTAATVARRDLLYCEWVVRVDRDATGVIIPMPKLCNFYCFSNGACEEILVTIRDALRFNIFICIVEQLRDISRVWYRVELGGALIQLSTYLTL